MPPGVDRRRARRVDGRRRLAPGLSRTHSRRRSETERAGGQPVRRGGRDEALQHRTARRFPRPSPLFRWCAEVGLLAGAGNALVFGAGLLVEARALAERGWNVDALERPDSLARRSELYAEFSRLPKARVISALDQGKRRYRLIVVTHVLEFIEDADERTDLLAQLVSRLAPQGRLLLSLRGWSDVRAAKTQVARGDGIVTGLGTWTRGFTLEEALELIGRVGLTVETGPRTGRSKTPEQVRLVCRRMR
jgi:hypothetical protein